MEDICFFDPVSKIIFCFDKENKPPQYYLSSLAIISYDFIANIQNISYL